MPERVVEIPMIEDPLSCSTGSSKCKPGNLLHKWKGKGENNQSRFVSFAKFI